MTQEQPKIKKDDIAKLARCPGMYTETIQAGEAGLLITKEKTEEQKEEEAKNGGAGGRGTIVHKLLEADLKTTIATTNTMTEEEAQELRQRQYDKDYCDAGLVADAEKIIKEVHEELEPYDWRLIGSEFEMSTKPLHIAIIDGKEGTKKKGAKMDVFATTYRYTKIIDATVTTDEVGLMRKCDQLLVYAAITGATYKNVREIEVEYKNPKETENYVLNRPTIDWLINKYRWAINSALSERPSYIPGAHCEYCSGRNHCTKKNFQVIH